MTRYWNYLFFSANAVCVGLMVACGSFGTAACNAIVALFFAMRCVRDDYG